MVLEKLCQFVRYKTVRNIVLVVLAVAFFANLFLVFFIKTPANERNGNKLWSSVDPRVSRVISRGSREFLPRASDLNANTEAMKGDRLTNPRTQSNHNRSPATENRIIHLDPLESLPVDCRSWCRRGHKMSPPYQLSAVLLVRVYRHDLAGLSSREMLQWLFYLRYAGFEHVFVYDAYVNKNESQYHVLLPLIQSGFITYEDWSAHNPYTIEGTQISAYQDCVNKYGKTTTWHIAIDIDEYPFSPIDVEPNFMQRFLRKFFVKNPHVSQVTLQNHLFLGKPLDPQAHPLLVARLRRRTREKSNDLGKSVFRVAQIRAAQVHHNDMRDGNTVDCDARLMRLNHYWGARLQDWGEDTKKILDMTEVDYSIKPIVDRLYRCSKCFGADSLYMRRWN